jgi:hypothetical protein
MACKCIKINYQIIGGPVLIIELDAVGLFNSFNVWSWTDGLDTFTLWHDAADNWNVSTDGQGGTDLVTALKGNIDPCPFDSMPNWLIMGFFDLFTTEACDPCDCIKIDIVKGDDVESYTVETTGQYGGPYNYYEFGIYTLFFNGFKWLITTDGLGGSAVIGDNEITDFCPAGSFKPLVIGYSSITVTASNACGCQPKEDRNFRKYNAIKLPVIFEEPNRGFFRCCCPFNVLANASGKTWENDVNSAWIKLSDPLDMATIELYKEGVLSTWQPVLMPFVNELNAFFATVYWAEVLAADGPGCYDIKVNCNISGIALNFVWGHYTLKEYSIQNALKTARIRTIFNAYQEIESIDFTGSQVEDSIRFYGFIGNRQPNTEIDNIIYQTRELKSVIRENLNTYEIITDPTCEEHTTKLTDLYLLSENELYLSDYNAHNHSYKYEDLPAIVKESPEITYFDFSRQASLKCIVGDKFNNKRTFYK